MPGYFSARRQVGKSADGTSHMHTLALDLINPEIERRRQVERPGCNVSQKRRNRAVRKGCKNNTTMGLVANVAQRCVASARL